MDGDFTYDASDIARFLVHVNGYDEIVGVRSRENIRRLHRFGNYIISWLFNALMNTHISDVCSGMYLLNTRSARELEFQTRGFSVEVEVLAQMALNGRVTEIPIGYRRRLGQPKLSTVIHGFDILRSIFGLARQYNPVFLFSLVSASVGIPGFAILAWSLWQWAEYGIFHSGWVLGSIILLLLASQFFATGTVALLVKRSELRIRRALVQSGVENLPKRVPV